MWLRDILEELCRQKLRDITDFEWQRCIRPYLLLEDEDRNDLDRESQNSSGKSSAHISLQCLDQQLGYGFEYQGCGSLPVMTPRMDNYILAFTQVHAGACQVAYYSAHTCASWCNLCLLRGQAVQFHLGSMLIGPAGSGKVQLIKVCMCLYRMYSIIRPPIFNVSLSLKWGGCFYSCMRLVSTVRRTPPQLWVLKSVGLKTLPPKRHVYINAEVVHANYSVSVSSLQKHSTITLLRVDGGAYNRAKYTYARTWGSKWAGRTYTRRGRISEYV